MLDSHQKNIATFIHLSTFSRFIIPLGNFIGPIILWVSNKDKSEFVDQITKKQNFGVMFKSGIKYRVKKLYFSVFVDYYLQHFHFSTKNEGIKRHSIDVGGLLLGFGIGKSF